MFMLKFMKGIKWSGQLVLLRCCWLADRLTFLFAWTRTDAMWPTVRVHKKYQNYLSARPLSPSLSGIPALPHPFALTSHCEASLRPIVKENSLPRIT